MENRNLNNLFYFLYNFPVLNDRPVSNYFYFLDPILDENFFSQDRNFIRLSNDGICLNYFLDNLWNLNDFLYCLYDRNWFFNNSVHNLVSDLNMVLYLFCVSILNQRNNLLNYLFDLNNLWNLHNFLNQLLYNDRNLNNLFHNLWLWVHNYLLNDWNLSDLDLNVVDYSFNFDNFLHLNNLFNNFLNSNNFRNFFDNLNDSFNDLWNFNDPFDNFFYWDDFLNYIGNYNWHFKRNINNLFDLFYFFNFDNLFCYLIDGNNLWNFNNPINNLLNYLLNFNHFRNNSKDFQDIIHIDNTHNFLSDHS